jgi:hypothetical protein
MEMPYASQHSGIAYHIIQDTGPIRPVNSLTSVRGILFGRRAQAVDAERRRTDDGYGPDPMGCPTATRWAMMPPNDIPTR